MNPTQTEEAAMVLLASSYDQSRFLQAADLDGEKKFRIKEVTEEEVGTDKDKEKKLVVWFTNHKKGLVLNKTNNRTLRGSFGDDTIGWNGKIVVVFSAMVDFRGRMTPGLRVRIPAPKQVSGDGQTVAARPPSPKPAPPAKPVGVDPELDEFDQPVSASSDLDDEIAF